MLITRSNIPSTLRPGLKTVFFDYNTFPAIWKNIYTQFTSDKATEYDLEMQGLGLAQLKQDGAPVSMGSMQQAYTTSYINQYYGIGFQITRASILDNQYPSEFPQQAKQLRSSLDTLKNMNGAALFNNAFTANATVSDGQPMCSTQHPTADGFLPNTFSNGVGLNQSALEDAITIIKSWTNIAGIRMNLDTIKLLVPQARQFDASRILGSQFNPDSANNAINPIVHDKFFPGGFIVNQFITNPNYWFILTSESNGFKYYLRESLDVDHINDPLTDNVTVRAIERYSMNVSNWRAVFGSLGV